MTPATPAPFPGEGPLLGPDARFRPEKLRPALCARESNRLQVALEAIAARQLEAGWKNPPIAAAIGALDRPELEALLLAPDFRRWTARIVRATHPHSTPDAALPVQVQAVWNQLAVSWLRRGADGVLQLAVFRDGTVPFPGSGLVLAGAEGRWVQLLADGDNLRFTAENGAELARVERMTLLAALDGRAHLEPPWKVAPRVAGIELSGTGDVARVSAAFDGLGRTWPGGASFVEALVRRIELDPNPELNSKTVSELPGLVILGGHSDTPGGAAELLVHEAMHLLVYELARLQALLPAPETMLHSPFSRADARPAFMVLHGIASFCAQAITTARWQGPAAAPELRTEMVRLRAGQMELEAHLTEHQATPHAFVTDLFGEIAVLDDWLSAGA
jgi:HEXXH motif-containing protein